MGKIYKKGITYYSAQKGIYGLRIAGVRNSGWKDDFCVVEDKFPDRDLSKRIVSFHGTLPECRDYLKQKFGKKIK